MKELAQLPRLCHADGALPVERFAHVAALAKHRQQQLGGGLAGMLDQELQVFGGGRVIWGHAMPAVVVLNKQKQQPHELGFLWCALAVLADEISGATDNLVGLNKQKQQPHELGFLWCALAVLADEISGATDNLVVLNKQKQQPHELGFLW